MSVRNPEGLSPRNNVDSGTVAGFGREWSAFDWSGQHGAGLDEIRTMFDLYFEIFPWDSVDSNSVGFDAGCGTGRWARFVAPRVRRLHLVDASREALDVARRNLSSESNCEFHDVSVMDMPFPDGSMDFGYSLGVLHHVPDTRAALEACVRKLKPGAPFLVYLYYALDNRPPAFRALWRASDLGRRVICHLPFPARYHVSQAIAAGVYYPLARGAALLERFGVGVDGLPLSSYRHRSFYVMRTDALDRFGTRLERRFSRREVASMMRHAGLDSIRFQENHSFWTAIGRRSP